MKVAGVNEPAVEVIQEEVKEPEQDSKEPAETQKQEKIQEAVPEAEKSVHVLVYDWKPGGKYRHDPALGYYLEINLVIHVVWVM